MDNSTPAEPVVLLDRLAEKASLLARSLNAAADAAAADAGLTKADADVLVTLHDAPEHRLKPSTLATLCDLSSGGTSNVILRLTRAGYVNREAHLHDGRSSWAQLTPEGENVARFVLESAASGRATLLRRWPDGLAHTLDELLDTALRHIEDHSLR
ncbi:MarR family winged helix-turn-helix transcriptional regulator [Streptomyces pratensis]|uniref:MarR family winged helix-turn-helix transcriptional regulator n=1 Tax=Streptomyces pratensis TaxID=1169025 RepID=UPI003015D303